MKNVYLYPLFDDKQTFDEVMNRAAWYFEPWLGNIKGFHVGTSFEPNVDIDADPRLDPAVTEKVPSLLKRTIIHNTSATTNASLAREAKTDAELLLIWKMPEDGPERAQTQALYDAVRGRGWLSYVVDKDNEMSHGCNWLWGSITLATRDERARLKANSYAALMRFAAQVRSPRAYVLGTGPNLEQMMQHDFSDGDCIIANSIIKNKPLMKRLDPIAVCACDPIFHAGVSLYAAEFRHTLIEAMDEYPRMYFFAPHRDEKIYLSNLPDRLHDRFIFVPIDTDPGVQFNFDLRRNFYLVPEGNVLTQMMLPIAAAFHEKISVVGCDGRPLSQNTYFWSHHKSSQFNDQMQNIQDVHPAFFSLRDYDDHYSEHCADTARIISNLEEAGKRVENLTDSYIPALRARYSIAEKALAGDTLVVSLNPNLRNRYGHLLGYDEGLRDAARASGAHFLTLGAKTYAGAQSDLDGADVLIEPCFSDNVYSALTRQLPDVDQNAVLHFEREFEAAVLRHGREHPGKTRAYYLYMGSLPHAVAMANVCARHPEISATVNTFGECIMDCMRDGYIDQWTPFLRSVAQQNNFAVLAITPQLKREVRARCGVDLPLCGHPTAAFSDTRFVSWFSQLRARPMPANPQRLIFPGGFWGEKNFDLTCDIAHIAHDRGYSCTVRTGPLGSANRQQLDARKAIESFARTADGVLSDEEYRGLFADADIAVLTYRRADWRIRNSSVVVDCLYAGLPMVVVSGTWLADLVRQYGCGEVVEREDAHAFMAAVESIRAQYSLYRSRTIEAARAYQSANGFADVLSAAISPIWVDADAPSANYDPGTIPAALGKMRAAALGQTYTEPPPPVKSVERGAMAPNNTSLVRQALQFELSRDADCMFEELAVARTLLSERDPARCVMIDVGAHSGGSFPPFIDAGWTVHAFEPDPSNRAGIPKRYLNNPRFILDPRALSDKVQDDVAFYTSTESTGISTLGAFHDTHRETTRVSVTTLANVIRDRAIDNITLLKVDTEGFDLFVLKGMDWQTAPPEVVITEFENNKTERLGYTVDDQIAFLEQRGYSVFVSEWWPIVRYGIRHHWRSLYPAAMKHPPGDSWGNLIAFRQPPPFPVLYHAMLGAIDRPREENKLAQAEREIAKIQAMIEAPTSPQRTAARSASSPARPSLGDWVRARLTPGRRAMLGAGFWWVIMAAALTAAAWYTASASSARLLFGALAGAAFSAWLGVALAGLGALVFLKRRGIVHLLAREPALVELLRRVNSLQRHRRREAIRSAELVGASMLFGGAVIGAACWGLSPWYWVPLLGVCATAVMAVAAVWALAVLLSLIRGEAQTVAAARYDRTIAHLQDDLTAQARAQARASTRSDELSTALTSLSTALASVQTDAAQQTAKAEQRLRAELIAQQQKLDAAIAASDQAHSAQLDALAAALKNEHQNFTAAFQTLDDAFRTDVGDKLADMRDDVEFAVRQRVAAAQEQSRQEAEGLAAQAEERLSTRFDAQQRAAAQDLSQVRAAIDHEQGASADEFAQLRSVVDEVRTTAADELADIRSAMDQRPTPNRTRFVNFNRELSSKSIEDLLALAKRLGVKTHSGALAYWAHRIEAMETSARGRLAASVETQILRNLVALSVRKPELRALEIGTLYGLGAASMLEATSAHFEQAHLTIIDPFAGYYGETRDPLIGLPITREGFEDNMRRIGIGADSYRILEGFSEDEAIVAAASNQSYQWLLIDGDHSYEGVRRDFENYAPMMDRYGFVLIDDYDQAEYDGIQRYVDETVKQNQDYEFVGAVFSTAIFRVWRKAK